MFKHYYMIFYKDLLFTLREEKMSLEEYNKEKPRLYLLIDYRIFHCEKRDLKKKIDEFFAREQSRGNKTEYYCGQVINKKQAEKYSRDNRTSIID